MNAEQLMEKIKVDVALLSEDEEARFIYMILHQTLMSLYDVFEPSNVDVLVEEVKIKAMEQVQKNES